jgi:hypothetical protein
MCSNAGSRYTDEEEKLGKLLLTKVPRLRAKIKNFADNPTELEALLAKVCAYMHLYRITYTY